MAKNICYISLGANQGPARSNILSAITLLQNYPGIEVFAISDIVETEPYGNITNQNAFINCCMGIYSWHSVFSLLHIFLAIEQRFKRVRIQKWGPRSMDIDILLYNEANITTTQLVIPHYDMHNRPFILDLLSQVMLSGSINYCDS